LGFFGLVYGFGAIQGTLDGPIADLAFGLSLAAIPISVAIAVLRYRLYEIDRVISRTIGWIVVTTMLAAFVGGAIIGLQALLAPFTSNNTLAVAVSTLLAAALFQPLRARVQRIVDRRFNRARVDAQQAVDAFGAHLRDDLELATLRDRLVSAAEAGVQPAGAGLWLRRRSGDAA
jgi:divalent metal cation (Fe/Co/Zn/Cd) transporter